MDNNFAKSAKYYNLIQDSKQFQKSIKFIIKILKKNKVKSILELGCGSGYYLFPIKKNGFDIEGLDIGKEILNEIKKRDKTVKTYLKDMSKFNINKKYDSILCLNSSLVLLPNFLLMKKTLERVCKHLKDNGLFILDVPNHKVEIKETDHSQDFEEFKLKKGIMHVVHRDYKKGNKWIAEQRYFVNENKKYFEFKEEFAEFIFNPKELEKALKKIGFKIERIHGQRFGGKFEENNSRRRFYICRKL